MAYDIIVTYEQNDSTLKPMSGKAHKFLAVECGKLNQDEDWGQEEIKEIIKKAREEGFEVLELDM